MLNIRPMVMLVGQYSTGKTTFIRYLLEQVGVAAIKALITAVISTVTL